MNRRPIQIQHFLVGFFMALVVAGCTSNPYADVSIDSTNKAIVVATAEVRAANLLLQEVIRARAISSGQAQSVKDNLQTAKDTLQASKTAVQTSGDPLQGQNGIETATRALDFALQILAPLVANLPPQARVNIIRGIQEIYIDEGLPPPEVPIPAAQPQVAVYREAA